MLTLAAMAALSLTAPPKRLLVCGGSGFLGREVCRSAVARGWAVTSLSRRGVNPEPGCSALDEVSWVAGDASDQVLLDQLSSQTDAFVHSVGLLLDTESGLGALNVVTSGSRSVPSAGATYDSVMRKSAIALLEAAKGDTTRRPFVFVSASEAGWPEIPAGRAIEPRLFEFLGRYLTAKRGVEAALANEASVRPLLVRPSLMWSWGKLDVLPILPVWNTFSALGVADGAFGKMLRVEVVGAAIVQALEREVEGVLGPADLEAIAPLSALMRVGPLETLTSGLASIARLPYGTSVAPEIATSGAALAELPRPGSLRLYEFEGCPFCRRVREVVSYLDLSLTVYPCARGSRHRATVEAAAASLGVTRPTYPYLEDDAAGVRLFESADIVAHLLECYGGGAALPPPSDYFLPSTFLTGWVPAAMRFGRGGAVEGRACSDAPAELLQLYSYDGNQFCRLVREALTELDLPYTLLSVAKGSPRREELVALAGRSTAPYLVDPNTDVAMFESADIVEYLFRTYSS